MNFSKFDVSILVTMSLAVVIMSFAFPALGLTDQSDEVSENDIPEFNMSATMFDFTGDFPREPNAADSGNIQFDQQQGNSIEGVNVIFVDRPQNTGAAVEVQNTSTNGLDFVFTNFTSLGSGSLERSDITPSDVGEQTVVRHEGWTITYTVVELNNYDQPNMTVDVDYQVQNAPEDTKGLSAIPIVGGVTDQIAQYVGWFATIFFWTSLFIVELVINVLGIAFGIINYTFGMASWLITTYAAIISAAPGWAGVVLVIPSVLLFAEFAKLAVIGIKLLPTT
jgi:hypothetical protein